MHGGPSGVGVKPGNVNADGIKVQVEEIHFFGFIFSEMVFGIPGVFFPVFSTMVLYSLWLCHDRAGMNIVSTSFDIGLGSEDTILIKGPFSPVFFAKIAAHFGAFVNALLKNVKKTEIKCGRKEMKNKDETS